MDFEKSKFKYFLKKMSLKNSLVKFLSKMNDKFSSKLKKKEGFKLNKENFNSWMNLTKKERFNLSNRDSINYLIERKSLLNQIREEYKNTIQKKI